MKKLYRAMSRTFLIGMALILLSLGIGYAAQEAPYTYHEFDGVIVYFKTQDISAYRELLPAIFDMPDEPMAMVFVMDYYKMDKATLPYREAAVFLLAKYKQKAGWHCVVMPVTSDEARIGGIQYLGFPKIMGDVRLEREPAAYTGTLALNSKTVLTVTLSPRKDVSPSEEGWFKRFQGLPSYNILNGKVYEPEFGGKRNALEVSRLYPDKFIVRTGAANLIPDAEAASAYSAHLARIFSIQPSEIVLAYYMKNTFEMNFGVGKFSDK